MVADKLARCITFLNEIGIQVMQEKTPPDCFLPGLRIAGSIIYYDPEQLLYPGDILHEAGHIAVVPAAEREELTAESIALRASREAEEMMAIAWSYAVCVHLNLEPEFVFHEHGYKSGGLHLAQQFRDGYYLAVPMLQWTGMCYDEKRAPENGVLPYPHMIRWMRE